jgi:hypothetical protein
LYIDYGIDFYFILMCSLSWYFGLFTVHKCFLLVLVILFLCIQVMRWRILFSGMLGHVALVRLDVLEECINSIIRVTRTAACIGCKLLLIVPSVPILVTLMMEAMHSSKRLILTRAPWHNMPEDSILLSQYCGNLKSYKWWDIWKFL